MDKEAVEKIAKLDYLWRFSGWAEEDTLDEEWEKEPSECIKQNCREFATQILKTLEQLGYRKLPQEKPRLLSDEEMMKALNRKGNPEGVYWIPARKIAQAQREADIKHYEGE